MRRVDDQPIAAEPGLPPRGSIGAGGARERSCARAIVGLTHEAAHLVCGKPGTLHIMWEFTPEGWETGWACAEHAAEVTREWSPAFTHPPSSACGMPGSEFDRATNTCVMPPGSGLTAPALVEAIGSAA